jgi:phosphate starvation-inducible protein PhoH and related proteins
MAKRTRKELKEQKNPTKFMSDKSNQYSLQIKLDNEQIATISELNTCTLALLIGKYGTGKSLTAVYYALKKYLKGEISKIYISRSAVCDKSEELGFVPGDIGEKMAPLVYPLVANMYRCLPASFIDYLMREKIIEVIPIQYLKGVTYQENSLAIVDESQNLSLEQVKNVVSRIGNNSQLILVGDKAQMDIKEIKSGLSLISKFEDPDFKIIELFNNHRHPIVERFTKYIESKK